MGKFVVLADRREQLGKNSNRQLRAQGQIPAVIYGHAIESVAVSVDPKDLDRILHSETGRNTIFVLEVGGKSQDVLIKDYLLDPIKGYLLHADFQTVAMDEQMVFEVPVQVVGNAKGVVEGGILDTVMRGIQLECLPGNVPDSILVEVSELDIGDSIRVSDLEIDVSQVNIISEPDLVVIAVGSPRVEEEPVIGEELEEGEEPELIGEKQPKEGEEEKETK
jgi:large subunit ribosomal protein L25